MRLDREETGFPFQPLRTFLVVLAIVFASEAGVMFALPRLLTESRPTWLVALVDASLLTILSSPILWWVLIRPLRRVALAEQARAASIVQTAADGIILIDDRERVQSINPAAEKLFGINSQEIIGKDVNVLVSAGESSRAAHKHTEIVGRRRDGSELPLALSVSEFRSAGRQMFTWIVRDLTERKRLEFEQRQREAMRAEHLAAIAQMATGVAHEVRNPLTSVKMLIQGSRMRAVGLTAEDLDIIEQEIRRVERCARAFLDFARPPKPDRRFCELAPLVERTMALVLTRAGEQHVRLRFQPSDKNVRVLADWEQIQQLLLNLVINALDAMPNGGELEFVLGASADGTVELRVLDTGPGISPELMPRLFQPFVTSKEAGVGLGLVVSRRIAEDHGGTLSVENRSGGGACFVLRLPTLSASVERGEPDERKMPQASNLGAPQYEI